jgi:hypothetical protein
MGQYIVANLSLKENKKINEFEYGSNGQKLDISCVKVNSENSETEPTSTPRSIQNNKHMHTSSIAAENKQFTLFISKAKNVWHISNCHANCVFFPLLRLTPVLFSVTHAIYRVELAEYFFLLLNCLCFVV